MCRVTLHNLNKIAKELEEGTIFKACATTYACRKHTIIHNVTHVFAAAERLLLYYEVYDPAQSNAQESFFPRAGRPEMVFTFLRMLPSSVEKAKVFERSLVELTELNAPDRRAGVFPLDLPLSPLKPGFYTCQVNVTDDAAGHFLFPRLALLIRPDRTLAEKQPAVGTHP